MPYDFEKLCELLNEKSAIVYPEEQYCYFIQDNNVCVESIGDPFDVVCSLNEKWYNYLMDRYLSM